MTLSSWPSLTLAVQNLWGGPDSSEKRDWFAGAISDLIAATPDADVEYLEEFLLQIMNDEFDVNVDDDSGAEVAAKIVGLRRLTLLGDFAKIDEMYKQWAERQSKGGAGINFKQVTRDEDDDDTDWDSDDMDEDNGGDEAPPLVQMPKKKAEPKVDEDGFTEVISKNRK